MALPITYDFTSGSSGTNVATIYATLTSLAGGIKKNGTGFSGITSGDGIAVNNSETFSNDQYAQFVVGGVAAAYIGVAVRCTDAQNFCGVQVGVADVDVFKLVGNGYTSLATPSVTNFGVGVTVKVTIIGTTMKVYTNGTERASVTVSDLTTGKPAMIAFDAPAGGEVYGDDVEFGNTSAAVDITCNLTIPAFIHDEPTQFTVSTPAQGGQAFFDEFEYAPYANLEVRNPEYHVLYRTQAAAAQVLDGVPGQLYINNGSGFVAYTYQALSLSADQESSLVFTNPLQYFRAGVIVRGGADGSGNGYYADYSSNVSNGGSLSRMTGGSLASLLTFSAGTPPPVKLTLRAVGSTLTVLVNDVQVAQTTDTTYPTGFTGLAGDGATGLDVWQTQDFTSGPATHPIAVDLTIPNITSVVSMDSDHSNDEWDTTCAATIPAFSMQATVAVVPSAVGPSTAQVTRHAITWDLSSSGQIITGLFVNGDPWVASTTNTISVTSISPGSTTKGGQAANGSELDPVADNYNRVDYEPRQGFNGNLYGSTNTYVASKNVGIGIAAGTPLAVVPTDSASGYRSLVSCISQGGNVTQTPPNLTDVSVLTFVHMNQLPPADAFRPPATRTTRPIAYYVASQLRTELLQNVDLSQFTNTAERDAVMGRKTRYQIEFIREYWSRFTFALNNGYDYYADRQHDNGAAILLANSTWKTNAHLYNVIQHGIDAYWAGKGGVFWGGSGHGRGRVGVVCFASAMLGNGSDMATVPADIFSEDGAYFYVQETSPGVYNNGIGGYTAAHVGMPEWSQTHAFDPSNSAYGDNVSWTANPYRRCCTSKGMWAETLAMYLTGALGARVPLLWKEYQDRYYSVESGPPYNGAELTFRTWHVNAYVALIDTTLVIGTNTESILGAMTLSPPTSTGSIALSKPISAAQTLPNFAQSGYVTISPLVQPPDIPPNQEYMPPIGEAGYHRGGAISASQAAAIARAIVAAGGGSIVGSQAIHAKVDNALRTEFDGRVNLTGQVP